MFSGEAIMISVKVNKRVRAASNHIYRQFNLDDQDQPFLDVLKFTNRHQYDALLIAQNPTWSSYDDFAATLGIPVGTLKSRLSRARTKIMQWRTERDNSNDKQTKTAGTG
jgi:hypothetical protein